MYYTPFTHLFIWEIYERKFVNSSSLRIYRLKYMQLFSRLGIMRHSKNRNYREFQRMIFLPDFIERHQVIYFLLNRTIGSLLKIKVYHLVDCKCVRYCIECKYLWNIEYIHLTPRWKSRCFSRWNVIRTHRLFRNALWEHAAFFASLFVLLRISYNLIFLKNTQKLNEN